MIKSLYDNKTQGKTFLTSIFCVVRAILYPESKIISASYLRSQSREVIQKIDDLRKNSPNLRREISDIKTSVNDSRVEFHNGSWIRTVASNDGARGARSNVLVVDLIKFTLNTFNCWKILRVI